MIDPMKAVVLAANGAFGGGDSTLRTSDGGRVVGVY